ncbi:MAG: NAD-dependent epimerase/dehydratase family protein, partial [Anaerolineae bacterium]|nr:NAD-dependent epimerase/dehydratase family protein [Anaerolineae bacterium]
HLVRTVDIDLDRLAHIGDHPCFEAIEADITDIAVQPALVEDINIIYHLASAHLDVTLSEAQYRRVNVEATGQLLAAAHRAGVRRFVHCSTNGVLGALKSIPADETTPCHPTNRYEKTKLDGERLALKFGSENDLAVVVIRPAWVYGPRCPRTEKLLRTIGKGRFIMFGPGQTWRHPVYISDAVRGLELAAQAEPAPGQIYFIAGEQPVTIGELVRQIGQLLEVQAPRLQLPLFWGKVAGYAAELAFKPLGQQPPVSRRSVDFFLKDNAYDISKAKRDLGFQPQIDLQAGLEQTINSYQNQHRGPLKWQALMEQ